MVDLKKSVVLYSSSVVLITKTITKMYGAAWNGSVICTDLLPPPPVSLLYVPRDPNNGVSKVAKLMFLLL